MFRGLSDQRIVKAQLHKHAPTVIIFIFQFLKASLDNLLVVYHVWYENFMIIRLIADISSLSLSLVLLFLGYSLLQILKSSVNIGCFRHSKAQCRPILFPLPLGLYLCHFIPVPSALDFDDAFLQT